MKKNLLMLTTLTLAAIWSISAQAEKKQDTPPAKTAIEPSAKAEKEVKQSKSEKSKTKESMASSSEKSGNSSGNMAVKVRDEAADQSIPQPVSVEGLKDHPTLKKKN